MVSITVRMGTQNHNTTITYFINVLKKDALQQTNKKNKKKKTKKKQYI
jgi:hypothetical protein